jgi:zinc-ribbon domain
MAFCNSCGTSIDPGTRFCSKCGAAVLTSSPAPAAPLASPARPARPVASAPAPTSGGGGALKAILIVVGVIILVGILGIASLGFFAWRVARHSHVRQNGENVKVETPFGTVESSTDPQAAAHDLGVDPYPGAQVLKEGSTSATFGGVRTVSLHFETSDSADKVCSFYKPKFPNAMVMSTQSDQCTIISNDKNNMITITAKEESGKTQIVVANVKKADAGSSSSN